MSKTGCLIDRSFAFFEVMRGNRLSIVLASICSCLGTVVADEVLPVSEDLGEATARKYCSMCHAFTEPDLLPQKSWDFLLTYMGLRLGVEDLSGIDQGSVEEKSIIAARKKLLEATHSFPEPALLSAEEWQSIRAFYRDSAPEKSLPQPDKPVAVVDNGPFEEKAHRYRIDAPITTLVHIDEMNQQVLIGDSLTETFTILDRDLGFVIDYPTPHSLWLKAEPTDEGVFLLSIGDLSGDRVGVELGRVFYGKRIGNQYLTKGVALPYLYRPSDMEFADLDADGTEELVVCNYGIAEGSVSVYRKKGMSGYEFDSDPISNIVAGPGAVECEIYDFNGDGLLDVAVLMADARENLSLYLNKGDFVFERKTIVESHAAFGYVGFQIVDFNKDGRMDFVTVNGDNGDSDPFNTLKPYHGIRVYVDTGSLEFEEQYFYPMYGAFGVEVEDFDLDGDLDIAAIAFHPDFNAENPEGFVFLEQTGPFEFQAKAHPASKGGRWLTMSAGDLDQDGDVDLVLGAGYVQVGMSISHPDLMNDMVETGKSLLFLNNQTID